MKKVLTLGFLAAITIELIQFVFTFLAPYGSHGYGRSVDIDDVILNATGVSIGYLVFKLLNIYLVKAKANYFRRRQSDFG